MVQYGTKLIPRSKPAFKKIYFTSVLPSGHDKRFKRIAFFRIGEMATSQASVLIHYLGDETFAVNFSHGNCKDNNHRVFHRIRPSVLADLSSIQDLPSNIYKSAIAKPPTECSSVQQSVCMPQNLRQIKNLQSKERQKSRLTCVICGLDELVHELGLILQIESECSQLLSYDTTFQLGDFYLSPLLYRHTLFSNSPTIPALFLIHEHKFHSVHEKFMQCLADRIPSLVSGKKNIPLVTDEEVGIKVVSCDIFDINKSFYYTDVHSGQARCWNHTINAAKVWLKKHGATSQEVPVYVSHLCELLNQCSTCGYEEKLKQFEGLWSKPLYQYEQYRP